MMIQRAAALAALIFSASVIATSKASAQAQQVAVAVSYVPSLRLDLLGGNPAALQAGAAIEFPFSNYFSIGGALGAGISSTGFSGRADAFGKFSLDPYHQSQWEPYIGGGVTVRGDGGGPGTRTYLLGFIGANGPSTGSIAPGVELGFGGGVRLGVTMRFTGSPKHN
ncbi:MAG TPA: hypothetical protein VIG47_11815 [Gemmatimonadaceae bacterium]